jgi:alkanesulfonate monooxygenase SsuD/methylene tetrahydromethanopterin reductase-like flavin-dependent oxidoreductase (luciferase family)
MPALVMNFDLRHPREFSPTGAEIYTAAFDICAWADERGFQRVGVPEHHQNDDGYVSNPLLVAAAIGARTRRLKVRTGIVIAPLYDKLRLAEEVAVADLCLGGRLELGMGLGVLRIDYETFGVDFSKRGRIMEELIPFLRQAWTGETFEYNGRTIRVLPKPVQQPMKIYLGGMTEAATDRAARLADGFHTLMPQTWEKYRASCAKFGKPDPGPFIARGPLFLWVTKDDKEKALRQLQPHFNQQIESYEDQNRKAGGGLVNPWALVPGRNPPYAILNPEEAIQLAYSLGPAGELHFQPLLSAIEPKLAWQMLNLLESEVLPHLGDDQRKH